MRPFLASTTLKKYYIEEKWSIDYIEWLNTHHSVVQEYSHTGARCIN